MNQLTGPAEGPTGADDPPAVLHLVAELSPEITFATHQAAVPLVRTLRVVNPSECPTYESLRIELTCEPPVVLPQTWHLSRVRPGDEIAVLSRNVKLDGGMLDRLDERMRATVTIRLFSGEQMLHRQEHELVALARNEWGGAGSMPELLASFVLPNDPAISSLLVEASDLLRAAGRKHSLEGYQAGNRERPWEIAAAIWTAVARRRLIYAEPPASFERTGQKIRPAGAVLERRLATCLDTAVLFAAALEQAGLHAIIGLVEGHAIVGVWLRDATLSELITDDASLLRRYWALNDLALFETTVACQDPPASFRQALEVGARHIREDAESRFVYALDIQQARGRGINPLPLLLDPLRTDATVSSDKPELPLELPPAMRPLEDEGHSQKPSTPEGRVEMWKRRLLDLTKRNRLLNLKSSKAAIRLICPDIGRVEDLLAADEKLGIVHLEQLPGPGSGRDADVFQHQTRTDYAEHVARQALERKQLVADLPKPELTTGLVELYRKAASDLREGGANTLYLAIGTLRWRGAGKADGPLLRAPILLVPVTLERTSAAATPKLSRHADETVVNMTLMEMLHQDFEISIPDLSGPLPTDEHGVNVPAILHAVRKAIGDARGWSVEDEVVLSTFSFAKYLMWKDLCDREAELKQSRFVQHMIEDPNQRYQGNAEFLDLRELDDQVHPRDLFTPLQADSSQVAAIHASSGNGDMVLEGPPGTGKSQTIANIIAQNLALGRRVLFVAEKMTALSVVHDRLADVGLGDFCLELHSSKATRRSVVDQLNKAWHNRGMMTPTGWQQESERLYELRRKLNALVAALHTQAPSGVSPRQAIAEAAASAFDESVTLDWPRDLSLDRVGSPAELEQLTELANTMGGACREVSPEDRSAFAVIGQTEWSNQWTVSLVDAARKLEVTLDQVVGLGKQLQKDLQIGIDTSSPPQLRALAVLAEALATTSAPEAATLLASDGEQQAHTLIDGCLALERYREAYARIPHTVHHELVASVDHLGIAREWREASSAFVIARFFRTRGVRKRAEAAWDVGGVQDVLRLANALAALRRLQEPLARFDKECRPETGWHGLDSDTSRIRTAVESGRRVRAAVAQCAQEPESLDAIRQAIRLIISERFDLLEAGAPLGHRLRQYQAAYESFASTYDVFVEVARLLASESLSADAIRALIGSITARSSRLNAWCRWQRYKEQAESAGLGALSRALEHGTVTPDLAGQAFRIAYCRWIAPLLIDSRQELREFSAVEHEQLVTRFRELDKRLAKITAAEIRARLSLDVPLPSQPTDHPGYGMLAREAQMLRSSRTVRSILGFLGPVVGKLMPCFMMSPMSVAQFIPAGEPQFDLVIFDEASQITTWDAIGAIARGKHVIIVGDPKQMPPTNFFGRSADDDEMAEEESSEAIVADLESILEEALAAGMRHRRLVGHYRSRHESLIAFSNHAYYAGELVTYPPAETRPSAVSLVRIAGAYQKGKERTNPIEAKAVVAEISRRLRDPARRGQRIGVVTMNAEQQRLIRNLLDDERRAYPEIEVAFKGADGEEEEMVYNLETVQGHERDAIFLSIGYGPTVAGARDMSMNFGPLNRTGGERRLNVAITRATQEVVVFASFGPEEIDLKRTKAKAVEDLKLYMDYAERGPVALIQATVEGRGSEQYDSPFEEAVARALRQRGWDVRTQIGVSRFRVDLGIVHPDMPGRFLAGVECDGASYHSSPTARDRDRIREGVLMGLGWNLLRLWSTDYFLDGPACIDRIDARLHTLLEEDRASRPVPSPTEESEIVVSTLEPDPPEGAADEAGPLVAAGAISDSPERFQRFAGLEPPAAEIVSDDRDESSETREMAASKAQDDLGGDARFHDDAYLPSLRQRCVEFVDRAGPMTLDYLAERIARAHGFARTGSRIRDRVIKALGRERITTKDPAKATIAWPAGTEPVGVLTYRGTEVAGEPRPWDSVPYAERLGLAMEIVRKHGKWQGVSAMATVIGLTRLKEKRRQELQALIDEAAEMG